MSIFTQMWRKRWSAGLLPTLCGLLVCASSCKTSRSGSDSKDVGGPTTVRPSWLLSPEQIEATVQETWGLTVSSDEAQRYFGSVHTLMGGTSVVRRTTLLTKPHELYILTLDSLSAWVADKLTTKQSTLEQAAGAAADQFAFKGFTVNGLNISDKIHDANQCNACFADDGQAWCDCSDGIKIGALATAGLSPASLSASSTAAGAHAWRKRLMHNMQDIGDFLMCGVGSIDNRVMLSYQGQQVNIAQYLVDDVFLPGWAREVQAGTAAGEAERRAWSNVIHSILIGQGCFMDLASTQN